MASRLCHNCGAAGVPLQDFSACKQVSYCSKLCQEDDWIKSHNASCTKSSKLGAKDEQPALNQKKIVNSDDKECANCGVQGNHFSMCLRCKMTPYCCLACQRQHWSAIGGQKKFCVPLGQRSPGAVVNENIVGGEKCAICQETLLARSSSILACSHVFHSDCLTDLRKSDVAQTCPTCRSSLYDTKGAADAITNSKVPAALNDSPAALLGQAKIAMDAKDYKKASSLFGAVLEQEPTNETALFCKAYIAHEFESGSGIDEASRCYSELLRLNPTDAVAQSNFGNLLSNEGKLEEAAEHYEAALIINPNHAVAHFNYAVLLCAQGKLVEAAEHYEAALKINPNHAIAHSNHGCLLMDQGKLVEAAEHFEAALKVDPNDAFAHSNYGNLLIAQGKLDEAAEHYEAALTINPNHADAHFNYAILLRDEMNDAKAALSHSRAAVELGYSCNRRASHGLTLFALGELALAEVELRRALEMKPGDTNAQCLLDIVLKSKS